MWCFRRFDYEYENFYFQAGDVGYKILDGKIWQLDAGLNVDLSGDVDRGDSPLFKELPDLHYPLNAFVTFGALTDYGLFDVRYDHEINNKHNGYILSASYTAYFTLKDWKFYPKLSQRRYSAEYVDYFYGVPAGFADPNLPNYRGEQSDVTELSVTILKISQPIGIGSVVYKISGLMMKSATVHWSMMTKGCHCFSVCCTNCFKYLKLFQYLGLIFPVLWSGQNV